MNDLLPRQIIRRRDAAERNIGIFFKRIVVKSGLNQKITWSAYG